MHPLGTSVPFEVQPQWQLLDLLYSIKNAFHFANRGMC